MLKYHLVLSKPLVIFFHSSTSKHHCTVVGADICSKKSLNFFQMKIFNIKVQLFWEGHKNFVQSSSRFWYNYIMSKPWVFGLRNLCTVMKWPVCNIQSCVNGTQITQLAYSSLLFILICLRIFLWTDAICPQSCCWLWHAITTSKVTATSLHCKYTQKKLGQP